VSDLEHVARVAPDVRRRVSRRTLIKRGVVARGLEWAAPAISTVEHGAGERAAGSPPPQPSETETGNDSFRAMSDVVVGGTA
jgi:hypothetical protein